MYQQNYVFWPSVEFAPFFSNGYLGTFQNITATDFNTSWFWPTSSTLGVPSCTLGCGRCAVTGGTVQLLYWPATATNNLSATDSVTLSTLGTVLTSPTYYISYRSVYASDGCSGVGPTHYDTIVPIPASETLSSVFGGTVPCDAHMRYTQEWLATASFNVTDMNEPVPFSIYSSQPWCATYQRDHGCQSSCPTGLPYKPLLVVPHDVLRSMDPAWASCYGDLRGQYDPPIALHGVASIAGPTLTAPGTVVSQTASATPASSPSNPAPRPTSATAEPDGLPTTTILGQSSDPSTYSKASAKTSEAGDPSQSTSQGTALISQDMGSTIASPLQGQSSAATSAQEPASSPNLATGTTQDAAGIIFSLLGEIPAQHIGSQGPSNEDPNTGAPAANLVAQEHTQTIVMGSQTIAVAVPSGHGSALEVDGSHGTLILSPGGPAGTVNGQAVSATADGGIILGQGNGATTIAPQPVETATEAADPGAGSSYGSPLNGGASHASDASHFATLPASQHPGGQPSGLSSIDNASHSSLAGAAATVVTIGSAVITAVAASSGAAVLAGSGTTVTVPIGSTATLDGQSLSFDDSGQLIAGSSRYTFAGVETGGAISGVAATRSNLPSDASATSMIPSNVDGDTSSVSAPPARTGEAASKTVGSRFLGFALLVALCVLSI